MGYLLRAAFVEMEQIAELNILAYKDFCSLAKITLRASLKQLTRSVFLEYLRVCFLCLR